MLRFSTSLFTELRELIFARVTQRAVRTISQMQVTQPIYAGSSDAWRQYLPYLGGAFDSLT